MTDRPPPSAPETEEAVIGCFFADVQLMEHWIEKTSGADVFFDLRYREVYTVMQGLYQAAGTFDLLTVRQKLLDDGRFEELGGMAFLMGCQEACVSPLRLPEYTAILLDKWRRRQLLTLSGQCAEWAYSPDQDVTGSLALAEDSVLALNRKLAPAAEVRVRDELPAIIAEVEEDFHRGSPMMKGLPSGMRYLDNMLCGLQRGDLIVLAARPSCGKTTLAAQIAEHIGVDLGLGVGIFSLEMRQASIVRRYLFSRARCDLQKARNGFIQKSDLPKLIKSSEDLARANIWISPPRRMTVEQLCAQARRMTRQHDLRLIVIDYFQLLRSDRNKNGRTEELEEISAQLKQLALDLDLPVLCLAQMNREFEKADRPRKPQMSDLKGCGCLEQDADVIGFLYDQKIKDDDNPDNPQLGFLERLQNAGVPAEWCDLRDAYWRKSIRRINLLVEKQREGPTGDVELGFVKPWLRFMEFNQFEERAGRRRAEENDL